ncbi:MAG: hypothetical protein US40_C0009G0021 [Candidatus Roizmanbacteria bacterium GW2011_GWC2_37_13]|uniref:HAD family hydrolase n=1 Tax=Candidatus Roizmanbacteria bacterium GW2011_GWC2_37_13 TaxID=1618486 RepID=A0A0G0GGW2_9BACT|nr:MAG: hypothetical protein US38_C0009G0024 [Candidatus Roizmanbacteria bacterium GW2011_GWC1_37_12]KKQ25315.1 MAG: hypothetical protein US40_C0009G0021 [Candidatus Roizmanbacteria bacterium GW2011_GWC2_37_13]
MILPKVLLFDLDETIVFSEEMKAKAWSDILKVFGFCWEKENTDGLTSISEELRPATGLSPHDFIKNLIENLSLLYRTINLYGENLSPEEVEYRKNLSHLLLDPEKLEKMIGIMKDYWTFSLVEQAKLFAIEDKIKEVPGAAETIKKVREKGYRIGIITQAPIQYAEEVLAYLGLIDRDDRSNDIIDVVVSGDMVEKPKPDPESLILATDLIFQKVAVEAEERRTGTKLPAKQKVEVQDSVHRHYFGPEEAVFPNPVAIIGDSLADIEAGREYPRISTIRKILINTRNLSPADIKDINPDFTINHFEELLPRLEGTAGRKIEKR